MRTEIKVIPVSIIIETIGLKRFTCLKKTGKIQYARLATINSEAEALIELDSLSREYRRLAYP